MDFLRINRYILWYNSNISTKDSIRWNKSFEVIGSKRVICNQPVPTRFLIGLNEDFTTTQFLNF